MKIYFLLLLCLIAIAVWIVSLFFGRIERQYYPRYTIVRRHNRIGTRRGVREHRRRISDGCKLVWVPHRKNNPIYKPLETKFENQSEELSKGSFSSNAEPEEGIKTLIARQEKNKVISADQALKVEIVEYLTLHGKQATDKTIKILTNRLLKADEFKAKQELNFFIDNGYILHESYSTDYKMKPIDVLRSQTNVKQCSAKGIGGKR